MTTKPWNYDDEVARAGLTVEDMAMAEKDEAWSDAPPVPRRVNGHLWTSRGRPVKKTMRVRNTRRILWWTVPWFGHHEEERTVTEWSTPVSAGVDGHPGVDGMDDSS